MSEGEAVEVQVTVVSPVHQEPGAGFQRTEGALADDEEWDAIMADIHLSRKDERRGETPDLPAP